MNDMTEFDLAACRPGQAHPPRRGAVGCINRRNPAARAAGV